MELSNGNHSERKWIGICFDQDEEHLLPVIRTDGGHGQKKRIKDISGIDQIHIFCIDFEKQESVKLKTICWPGTLSRGNLLITYQVEEQAGEVRIEETEYVWHFKGKGRPVVDRDKVREIEQEKAEPKIVWPEELAAELQKEIYGQDEAIRKMSELIAGNLRRKKPEAEVIVLFGPTGVGKTEVGKCLAPTLTKLTGNQYGFQQVALNEFVGEHSVNRFFGSPAGYVGYGDATVFEPLRKNPYHVYLLDEIEKATDRIWTGLMEAFSTGYIHMADNSPAIDLNRAVIIITSNIPIDMEAYNRASAFQKKELCRDTLAAKCGHAEIAGKITNCLAFQPLSSDALTDIVGKFVMEELDNYDMSLDHMDEHLMVQLKQQHSNYGARGVKDAVREALNRKTVYDRSYRDYMGKRVVLSGSVEDVQIEIL